MTLLLKPVRGGRPVVIDKPIVLVGRHADCDLIITDSAKISRKHCCLALVNSRFVVRDLDSMNGVWVNRDRVDGFSELTPGDELMIGDVAFEVMKVGSRSQDRPADSNPESVDLATMLDASGEPRESLPKPRLDKTRVVGENGKSVDIREARGSGKIEFSSAMAIPTDSQEDDFVVPLGDVDD